MIDGYPEVTFYYSPDPEDAERRVPEAMAAIMRDGGYLVQDGKVVGWVAPGTTMVERPNPPTRREQIVDVLDEHPRGDWSDRTYCCRGCSDRFIAATENGEAKSGTELRAWHGEYAKVNHPGWSLSEYHEHVAEMLDADLDY